jgi:hypothetical protein
MKRVLTKAARRKTREATLFVVAVAILTVLSELLHFAPFLHRLLAWLPISLDEMVHGLHLSEAVLLLAAVVYGIGWNIWGRVPTFGKETTVEHLAFVPDRPPIDNYRYRMPRDEIELGPFVSLSDDSSAIAGRHPDLQGPERLALYRKWFLRQRRAFLLLDRWAPAEVRWEPIAVSILLPLTDAGGAALYQRSVAIVGMHGEIAEGDDPSGKLLLDTWIVKPKGRARGANKAIQVPHERFGHALPIVHLGVFWNGADPTTLIVEADNEHIRRLCAHVGFDGSRRTKDGAILQVFAYPRDIKDEGDSGPFFRGFSENVVRLRAWPIAGYRS